MRTWVLQEMTIFQRALSPCAFEFVCMSQSMLADLDGQRKLNVFTSVDWFCGLCVEVVVVAAQLLAMEEHQE